MKVVTVKEPSGHWIQFARTCVDALNACIHKAGCQSTMHPVMTTVNMYRTVHKPSTAVALMPKRKRPQQFFDIFTYIYILMYLYICAVVLLAGVD